MATPLLSAAASAVTAAATPASSTAAAGAGAGFGDSITSLLSNVEGTSSQANDAVSHMIDGTGDVHEAMIALQKSDVMLQLTVQIRNKLVQAYQDVMRMPI